MVMSYNIKGHGARSDRRHVEKIAGIISREKPDVAGIQEVHRRTLSVRTDQLEELERLTGLNACFGRSTDSGTGEYGNAVLTRGRILSHRVIPLPGRGERRSLLVTEIEIDGRILEFMVTHLSAWGPLGRRQRLVQTETIVTIAETTHMPFVLAGDFNSKPTGKELAAFHSGDLVVSCFPEGDVTHRSTRQCLDYIFAHPSWKIGSARVVPEGPSDHWPLLAALAWEGESGRAP